MTTAVPWYLDTLPKGYAPAGRWRDGIVVEGAEFTPAQASFASSVWVSTTDPYTDEDQFDCGWQHARYGDSGSSGLGIETLLTGPYTGCPALGAAPAYWQSVLPFQYANTPYVGDHTETGSVVGDLWSVYFNVVLAEVNVASATSNNTKPAPLVGIGVAIRAIEPRSRHRPRRQAARRLLSSARRASTRSSKARFSVPTIW